MHVLPIEITNLVSQTELLLTELHTPAKTFGNAESLIVQFASELKANSAQPAPNRCMNPQAGCDFPNDCAEMTSLVACR